MGDKFTPDTPLALGDHSYDDEWLRSKRWGDFLEMPMPRSNQEQAQNFLQRVFPKPEQGENVVAYLKRVAEGWKQQPGPKIADYLGDVTKDAQEMAKAYRDKMLVEGIKDK